MKDSHESRMERLIWRALIIMWLITLTAIGAGFYFGWGGK